MLPVPNLPATVTLALALTVLAPALCLLEARQVYRVGLLALTFSSDWITSPDRTSSTDASEICGRAQLVEEGSDRWVR